MNLAVASVTDVMKRRFSSLLVSVLLVFLSGLFLPLCGKAIATCAMQRLSRLLETRFERPVFSDWSAIRGLVVLGGQPARLKEAFRLMRDHPHLRLVMSGPNDYEMNLLSNAAETIRSHSEIERNSLKARRNTCGNAVFSAQMIAPGPGDRWLLVTSALHMTRAIGAFRKAGFPVEPWPVYDTGHVAASWRAVLHEWIGLIAYRLVGCSDSFLPNQQDPGHLS